MTLDTTTTPTPVIRAGRPTREQAEAREQAILDAALELVMDVGYDRLSMDALAERAGASKATIYRRWSGKAEVVAEAVRRRQCPRFGNLTDTGSLRGNLLLAINQISCAVADEDVALIMGVMSAMRADAVLAELLRTQVFDTKRDNFDAIIALAVGRGELPADATADVLHEVMSAVVFTRLVIEGEPVDDAFAVHLVDDIVLPLLHAPRAGGDQAAAPRAPKKATAPPPSPATRPNGPVMPA